MRKILLVNNNLRVDSGTMKYIIDFLKNRNPNKYVYSILYFEQKDSSLATELKEMGINLKFIPMPNMYSFLDIKKFEKLINVYLLKEKFDIIHSHTPNFNPFIFKQAQKVGTKVCISHSHSTERSNSKIKKIRNTVLNILSQKYTSHYLACSEEAAKTNITKHHIDSVKIVKNGIDLNIYQRNKDIEKGLRNKYKLEDFKIIGHIGRFSKEKNHKFLIDIFSSMLLKMDDFRLVLVGDGPEYDNIKSHVEELKLENHVLFLGARKDVDKILNLFDVMVLPSIFEGFGLVALEAQAMGIPVLINENLPISLNITNEVHRLSLDAPTELWVETIVSLSHIDKSMIEGINKQLIEKKGFNIENTSLILERFYDELLVNRSMK